MALARWTPSWGLTRWQPASEFRRLSEEMDRIAQCGGGISAHRSLAA